MEQFGWVLWLVLGAILIVAEVFTLGFVLFWFGIAALAAAAVGYFGFGIGIQFLVFAVVSVSLTAMSRTIFAKYLPHNETDPIKMGIAALPGKIGTVSIASHGAMNEAAVRVYGSIWTAFPADEKTVLVEGEKVEVVEVKGSTIYVRRAVGELPEWRS